MAVATKPVKLHNAFVPKSYELHVTVDLANWAYDTKETILLRRVPEVAASNELQLHFAPSMTIRSVTGATVVDRNEAAGTLLLRLDGQPADAHTILVDFAHTIQEEMRGFYRANFTTSDEVVHRIAATHFEPTAARRFYICHDEPAARADFTLHVSLPSAAADGFTVLSNGPLQSTDASGALVTHHFATVPAIPPYLTCCFIGELDVVAGATANGTPVKVYTARGRISQAAFALKTTIFALEYFEKFFDCAYPLPKLDMIAVPDFPIGGMENWGCIACVESILVDESTSSVEALKRAAVLICHEVSHNWFGNLVAVNWWEGLWLKEGFASWCGYSAAHAMRPTWRVSEDAVADAAESLVTDMCEHSHPVEVPICDPAEITEIFDSISYDKGMGIVFMLQAFLGDKWGPAVAHYIAKHRYSDTKTIQLWEALEESSGVALTEAMQLFTTQMGYPMIHVSRPKADTVVLRQETCQHASAVARRQTQWCVPIVLEGAGGAALRVMLRGLEPQEVPLPPELAQSPWINANPRRQGFFRCHYDEQTFYALFEHSNELAAPDRCSLLSDTLAGIHMGYEVMNRLALFPSFHTSHEKDLSVVKEYYRTMESFLEFIENSETQCELRSGLMYHLTQVAANLLDTVPTTTEERMRRSFHIEVTLSTILRSYSPADAREMPVVQWALREAAAFFAGEAYLSDTLAMTLATYARLGGDDNKKNDEAARCNALWQRFTEVHANNELAVYLLRGLCWSNNTEFVEDIVKRCVNSDGIRSQHGGIIFSAISSNPSMPKGFVWSLFKKYFAGIDRQWGRGTFRIQRIVTSVASTLSGETKAKEFLDFFTTNPLPFAKNAVFRAAEDIRLRAWLQAKWGGGSMLSHIFFPK